VYSVGAEGHLACLDGATGEAVWSVELQDMFGTDKDREWEEVRYGRSGSPLIVGDMVVVPAGGTGAKRQALAAFDCETGKRKWTAGDDQISYSSPALLTLAGRQQIVSMNEATVTSHDPANGDVLWKLAFPGKNSMEVNAAPILQVSDSRFFLSKGYGVGASVYEVTADGDKLAVKEVWSTFKSLRTKFTNVVLHEGHAYGMSEGIMECIELDTGNRKWKSGRFRHSQLLKVGSDLLIQTEDGWLIRYRLSPESATEKYDTLQVFQEVTWNYPALYGNLLLIRNAQQAACIRLPLAETPK
jgi:outer membrane protein assembly factor BamB